MLKHKHSMHFTMCGTFKLFEECIITTTETFILTRRSFFLNKNGVIRIHGA